MVTRKTHVGRERKPRQAKTGLKVKRSFNYEALPDAVVDGRLVDSVSPGCILVIVKPSSPKPQISLCEVKKLEAEPPNKGGTYVTTWDLTLERFLCFSTSELATDTLRQRYGWSLKIKEPVKASASVGIEHAENREPKIKLPIVNDPNVQPVTEPKLLQIQEPSGEL